MTEIAIIDWFGRPGTSVFSENTAIFIFKPATNGQSNKVFLLTSKVCPHGIVSPCPGAIYIY